MDVLNTYGGGVDVAMVVVSVLVGIMAIGMVVIAVVCVIEEMPGMALLAAAAAGFFVVCCINIALDNREPIRHEVVLRPGYVIDATKYEIIEQRGEIYVIEEREGADVSE